MNGSEMRRLVVIVLPAAFLLAVVAFVTVLALRDEDSADAPGSDGPRVNDHWHARYEFVACGVKQPNAPHWTSGVNTEADGIIHISPRESYEEGRGARLIKWFEYGGGELTDASIRMPGIAPSDAENIWENGEQCPDGSAGVVQVSVNGEPLDDWSEYIPQDGDSVGIIFGREE